MANDLQTNTIDWRRHYQGYQGQQRPSKDVTTPNATQRPLPPSATPAPSTNIATKSSPSLAQKAWNGTKGVGKVLTGLAGINGLIDNAITPSEDYYERFGMTPYDDSRGALGHFGVRALGFASDVGNALSGGTIGDIFFADKIRKKQEAEKAKQAQNADKSPQQSKVPNPTDTNSSTPTSEVQNIVAPNNTTPQPYIPQMGVGVPVNNPNYTELVNQINQMQQRAMADTQAYFGKSAHIPHRDQENQQQREALLRQATTVHKGAHGLTANQMRLAHELTNDDIKLAQERYMQQNNLNHQLQQEQLQQQAQNARTLTGEQGAMARAVMNEQGQNDRFNKGFGLDVARFNQDVADKQYAFGLQNKELNAKLEAQSYDNAVKQELNGLYHNYGLAQTDEERKALYDRLGFLTGKVPDKGNPKDYLMTVDGGENFDYVTKEKFKNPQRILDTRTMQYLDVGHPQSGKFDINNPNHQAHLMELVKKETSVEGRKKLLMQEMGMSEEEANIALQVAQGAK